MPIDLIEDDIKEGRLRVVALNITMKIILLWHGEEIVWAKLNRGVVKYLNSLQAIKNN